MIDLALSRDALLDEIHAPLLTEDPIEDFLDPRASAPNARLLIRGRTRHEIFPVVRILLQERFPSIPPERLTWDLLLPLKRALGNAQKHGNAGDPAKEIRAEIVLSPHGAVVAITDQGEGFDVAEKVRRLKLRERYFKNHGAGLREFERATSLISYDGGGSTLLLCYRPSTPGGDESAGRSCGGDEARPGAIDPDWIREGVSSGWSDPGSGGPEIEAVRTCLRSASDVQDRVLLRLRRDGRPVETRILTSRLHADEAAAANDFDAAGRFHALMGGRGIRAPAPVARLPREPRLILFEFDPWMDLWDYQEFRDHVAALRHSARRVGRVLATLHRSDLRLPNVEPPASSERFEGVVALAERHLRSLPGGSDLASRYRGLVDRARWSVGSREGREPVPIHGALGWDSICYGVDNRFYLYRFEESRMSDPGLDLGGFAADLRSFTLTRRSESSYLECRDAFLESYNDRAGWHIGADELRLCVAMAVSERLQRTSSLTPPRAQRWIEAMEKA